MPGTESGGSREEDAAGLHGKDGLWSPRDVDSNPGSADHVTLGALVNLPNPLPKKRWGCLGGAFLACRMGIVTLGL